MSLTLGLSLGINNQLGGGGGDAYPQFSNPKIGTIGDSLVAHGVEGASPGTTNAWATNAGELNLALMMHQRFRHDNWPADTTAFTPSSDRYTTGGNQAISGSNATSHRAMLQNYLLPMHPHILFYRPSVNNSVGTDTGPATFAYFQETVQIAMDAGVFCVIGTMCPWVNDPANAFNGADNNANRAYINAAIRAWVPTLPKSKAILVDYDIALDPTNTGWTDRSNMSDYIHLGTQGALKCARLINTILDTLIPARNYALELWNGASGPNKYPFPILAGNGGVTANGTGPTPTGMRTQRGGTGSSTLVLSTEANAETGGLTRVFTITAVGTGAAAYYQLGIGTTGDFTVTGQTGQWVRSIAEIEVMGNDALLVPQLWANGRRALYENGWSGLIGDAQQQTYWLVTDAVQVGSDTANLSIRLYPNADRALGAGGTATMVAKVKRLGYYFVSNPRTDWA